MESLLRAKNIPAWIDFWGHDVNHDWPWWHKQRITFLNTRRNRRPKENLCEDRPEDYVTGEKTPRRYRNPFLAQAMAELNMIDTMGCGIHSTWVLTE